MPLPREARGPSPRELYESLVVDDRFEIVAFAGEGGMGTVYRALDRATGSPVALKVMTSSGHSDHVERFAREARVLAALEHPGIVRYVAHGVLSDGASYLAMDWLVGEDLAVRIGREDVTVGEALRLARATSAALALAHARGVTHRDVKPSNLFLVDGDAAKLKVLDFGIARTPEQAAKLTATGIAIGTMGYMAPEQARGERDVDGRADVFSLGCVLFECVTGQAPFVGPNPIAVLTRVLMHEPPRVEAVRPGLPLALGDLVARMLAKDPALRPTMAGVGEAIDAITPSDVLLRERPHAPRATKGLSGQEQRVLCLLLVALGAETDATMSAGESDAERALVKDVAARFEASCTFAGSSTAMVLVNGGGAGEQVSLGARCGLALSLALPHARIVLATGRAQTSGGFPVGPVIDAAVALLQATSSRAAGVWTDQASASLLEPSFELEDIAGAPRVVRHHEKPRSARLVVGRVTPFFGREKELALLESTLAECADERCARAVLMTALPGMGKSRLRDEFVRNAIDGQQARVLTARGEQVRAGSTLSVARQLLRAAASVTEGDPLGEQQARVGARVRSVMRGEDGARAAEILAEALGPGAPGEGSPLLRAARVEPRIMMEWMRRLMPAWLAAEARAERALLVIIDDAQWADTASLQYMVATLREAEDAPLMVLGLARPEVHETTAGVWNGASAQEVSLGPLSKRSAERLARAVLGEGADVETVARVVARAAGNVFFLEELLRRVASNGTGELPDTVLAVLDARLQKLSPGVRCVLRAASVFGERFWDRGVLAVLGAGATEAEVTTWLAELERHEMVALATESRFAGHQEYRFRHALMKEAAYATLTAGDRETGHRLAGA